MRSVRGISPQEADVIEAPLDGVGEGVRRLRHPGRISKGQGAGRGTHDNGAPGQMRHQGGLRVVAVQDDYQVIAPAPQFPDQPEKLEPPSGVGIVPGQVGVMGQQRPENPVPQNIQLPGRKTLLQGPDGRGGEQGVPQGGGTDEQHPPDPGKKFRLQVRKGPGRPPGQPAPQILATQGQ